MAQTELTVQSINSPFASISAGGADFTFAAGDVANGNSFECTGNELIIVQNTGASPYTFTITSVADEKNRTGDVSAYSLAAGDFAVFGAGLSNGRGWKQSNGLVYLAVENASVEIAILRLPAIRG